MIETIVVTVLMPHQEARPVKRGDSEVLDEAFTRIWGRGCLTRECPTMPQSQVLIQSNIRSQIVMVKVSVEADMDIGSSGNWRDLYDPVRIWLPSQ